MVFYAETKDEVQRYGPELSDVSENFLLSDKQYYRTRKTQPEDHAQQLVAYILSKLCPGSKQALSVSVNPDGFKACKVAVDAFGLWLLVLKTQLYGSGRTKQRFFVDLMHVKQSGSHEAYIGELRARAKLVVGYLH